MPSDEDLLSRVASGDRAAFEDLFARYSPRMFGLLVKIMGNRTDADDALQDSAVHLWRNAASFRPDLGPAASWILMVTRSRGIDAMRRRRRGARAIDPLGDEADAPGAASGRSVSADDEGLPRAIEHLTDEQRTVIHLAFDRGLTREQIAAALGVPVGTVKTRVRAGVRRLAEVLSAGSGHERGFA